MQGFIDIMIAVPTVNLTNLIYNLLDTKGYSICSVVNTSNDLIDEFHNTNPDIVIFDLSISSNYIELIREIKRINNQVLILVIGEDVTTEFKNNILNLGADDYLYKPFQPAYLWERLDKLFYICQSMYEDDFDNENNSPGYLDLPKFRKNQGNSNFDDDSSSTYLNEDQYYQNKNKLNLKSIFDSLFKK